MFSNSSSVKAKGYSLTRDYAWYLTGNIAMMVAGMLSLPITSRLLTAYDFGLLGFYDTLGMVWMAVLKLGMQHALLRFHPTHCLDRSHAERAPFYATFIWYPMGISVLVTIAAVAVSFLFHRLGLVDTVWYLVAALIWSELLAVASFFQNLYVAERKSHLYAITNAVLRWTQLILIVPTILFIWKSAAGVMAARLVATALVAGGIAFYMFRQIGFDPRQFSRMLFKQALGFGIPLSLNEVASYIHDQIDRVLLRGYMNLDAVGIYHINYSVASYLGTVLSTSFYPAFTPLANRIYDGEGAAAYREKACHILRPLYYLAAALLVGVATVGADLVRLFVGGGKAEPRVFALVAVTYIATPIASVMNHGLVLEKRSRTMMNTLIASCVVNVAANAILIPRYGIMGAAYSTVISFVGLFAMRFFLTSKATLPIGPPADYLRPAGLGFLLYAAVRFANHVVSAGTFGRLVIAGSLFVVVYIVPSLAIDTALRQTVWGKVPLSVRRHIGLAN